MTRPRVNLGFDRFSGLYMWAVFLIVFAIWTPQLFLTSGTLHSVASAQAIDAIVAIAVLIPMAAGHFDLSVGVTVNLAAILVTTLQTNHHWSMWPAIGATVAVSMLIGVVNGLLVVRFRIGSFIATLGMASIITAVMSIVTNQTQPLPVDSQSWLNLTQTQVGGFQIVVLYLVVIAVVVWWALTRTPIGRYLYATGGNADAARLSGVRTGKWTFLSMVACSTLCGVAGVLYASLYGPDLTFGQALLLPAFAAVFLGSTQLTPGRVNVWGTLIALYALATGIKGLQLVTGVQWLPDMFNGIALLVAVGFAVWRQDVGGRPSRWRRRPSAAEPATEAAVLPVVEEQAFSLTGEAS
jgi:ribose transport system permease protein